MLTKTKRIRKNYPRPPFYRLWCSMKCRCREDRKADRYRDRGLSVCDEWANSFTAFRDWVLANGYKPGLHIDRIDNNRGYSPDNCRFVTIKQNNQNKRNNVYLTLFGERKTVQDWSEDPRCRVSRTELYRRILRGDDHESALTTPTRGRAA
jgi:hypothetical protein